MSSGDAYVEVPDAYHTDEAPLAPESVQGAADLAPPKKSQEVVKVRSARSALFTKQERRVIRSGRAATPVDLCDEYYDDDRSDESLPVRKPRVVKVVSDEEKSARQRSSIDEEESDFLSAGRWEDQGKQSTASKVTGRAAQKGVFAVPSIQADERAPLLGSSGSGLYSPSSSSSSFYEKPLSKEDLIENDHHVEIEIFKEKPPVYATGTVIGCIPRRFFVAQYYRDTLNLQTVLLILYIVLLVVFGAANSVTFRYTYAAWPTRYAVFVNQWTTLLYCLIGSCVLVYKFTLTNDITPEMRKFPSYKFALMGTFDAVSGILGAMGATFTPGEFQTLINQTQIPITIVSSLIFLSVWYTWQEYVGSAIIIVGACIAVVPSFFSGAGAGSASGSMASASTMMKSAASSNMGSDSDSGSQTRWYGVLIYILSMFPSSFSSVYKEAAFNRTILDIYYLSVWVSWFQFFIGLVLAPLQAIPGFGVDITQVPVDLYEGFLCFFGSPSDTCSNLWIPLLIYVFVNFFYNVFSLLVTKHGSATTLMIAYAIQLPIANLTFTSKLIMGPYVEPFSWYDIGGLVVVLIGFVIYSYGEIRKERIEKQRRVEAGICEDDEVVEFDEETGETRGRPRSTSVIEFIGPTGRPQLVHVPHNWPVFETPRAPSQLREHHERSSSQIRSTYLSRLGVRREVTHYEFA